MQKDACYARNLVTEVCFEFDTREAFTIRYIPNNMLYFIGCTLRWMGWII